MLPLSGASSNCFMKHLSIELDSLFSFANKDTVNTNSGINKHLLPSELLSTLLYSKRPTTLLRFI